ncbi:MAG: ABC transporter permease [Chloroflexi bacterium]|nr:ABC transporter permease [Chloroflexota bacterium]
MKRALLVALREVRAYLQDKGDLAFSLLLPIAIFALMYGAFGGRSQFHGMAHVVNEDNGTYSSTFLTRLDNFSNMDIDRLSTAEAQKRLERSDLLMVIYIPSDFSAKLASEQPTQLLFRQRGNGGQEGQIVAGIARSVAEEMSRELQVYRQVSGTLQVKNIPPDMVKTTVQKFIDREHEYPLVGVEETLVGNSPDPVKQFFPGIVTMFVLFAISLSARTIVEERKRGTLERLLTTRLSVAELFAGKFLSSLLRGFIQTSILLVLAYLVFQVFTPLTFLEALVMALLFSAAASAVGLLIGSLAHTEDQATWIAVFFTMAMVMLSGTFVAVREGTFLYTLTKFSMNTYANTAFRTLITGGGTLVDLPLEIGVMAGIIAVGLPLSRLLFKAVPGSK